MNNADIARKFTGFPPELLPDEATESDDYGIVREGPRNLFARPFDYRNPFPLHSLAMLNSETANGANTLPGEWPITNEGKPFDYYLNGNSAIGLPGGPENALIDIHGTLRGFTGAWAFSLGQQRETPELRVRQLVDGHWPVVQASGSFAGMACRFEYYAAPLAGAPLCNYPVAGNDSYSWVGGMTPRGRNILLTAGCTVHAEQAMQAIVHLHYAQHAALCAGAFYMHPAYAPAWASLRCVLASDGCYRLLATAEEEEYTLAVLRLQGASLQENIGPCAHWPQALPLSPERPAEHHLFASGDLAADETLTVEWLIPLFPLPSSADACLLQVDPRTLREEAQAVWRERRRLGMQLEMPEAKVRDAFIQALNHLDMCSVTLDHTEFPTPGPSGGHHVFYDRDNIDLIYAYDLIGDHARAARMIENYFLRETNQETSGMILWLLGKHLAITRDTAWARQVFPLAMRCMTWLMRTWLKHRDEHGGLLPKTSVPDNELAIGHYVSYHLYSIAGIRQAVSLAEGVGEQQLAGQWSEFLRAFQHAVEARLEQLVGETDGVITPCFEGFTAEPVTIDAFWEDPPRTYTPAGAYGRTGGCDWHNIAAVFPTGVLAPHHPWINASLERWRHAYIEGIFPYPSDGKYWILHNYNTMNLSETWLRRGDHAETLRDLYGLLLHTTACHASAEGVDAAARRDFNCTPHNWFSAKLVRFIRDLLVYEGTTDQRLHLFGGLSPAWMSPGMVVGLQQAPTELGEISFRACMRDGGMNIDLSFTPRVGTNGFTLHLPPFLANPQVTADGSVITRGEDGWQLEATARTIQVTWEDQPLPNISFATVAEAYVQDYQRRAGELMNSM